MQRVSGDPAAPGRPQGHSVVDVSQKEEDEEEEEHLYDCNTRTSPRQ